MSRKQRRDVVFARRVEAEMPVRHVLAQQPVGADDRRLCGSKRPSRHGVIQHEEMIAKGVVLVAISSREQRGAVRSRRHLVIEDIEAQTLRLPNLFVGRGEPNLQGAEATQRWVKNVVQPEPVRRQADESLRRRGVAPRRAQRAKARYPRTLGQWM